MYSEIIDFIRDIFGEKENFIPLHAPTFIGNEKKYLNECIDSTFVSSVGKFVDLFEKKIAEYTGAKFAVVCVNGTNALQVAMQSVGVDRDTEVITQPLTFVATVNAISYLNANPVFVDVDKETMGLSPISLKEFLSKNTNVIDGECINHKTGRKIKACVPMHTFGMSCKIEEIKEICNEYCISLIEDAAESLGSTQNGKQLGTFGTLGVYSFNGNKIITSGGGGVIVTDNECLAKSIKHLTTQAKVPHSWEYNHDEIGYNFRMPNINAALGLAQLENIELFIERKRKLAEKYKAYFSTLNNVDFISEDVNNKSNYWLNAICFENREARDLFLKESNESGVMTRPIWTLMNKLEMFKDCQTGDLTNAEWLEDRIVNIPSSASARIK